MSGRNVRLVIMLLLLGLVSACSKKESQPGQPQASQSSTQNAPAPPQPATSPTPPPAAPNAAAAPAPKTGEETKTEKPPAATTAVTVPSGRTITIRLGSAISTKTSQAGQPFSGSVAKPVVVSGKTVIPEGAKAEGEVASVKAAGKISGGAQLALKLTSIEIRGQKYPVHTSTVAQTGKGKGKRTAVMGGGGAAAGALVGGLLGGGKGAAVGLLAGGGAGTAGSAFTGDANITLPAESALSFQLSAPLKLEPGSTADSGE